MKGLHVSKRARIKQRRHKVLKRADVRLVKHRSYLKGSSAHGTALLPAQHKTSTHLSLSEQQQLMLKFRINLLGNRYLRRSCTQREWFRVFDDASHTSNNIQNSLPPVCPFSHSNNSFNNS